MPGRRGLLVEFEYLRGVAILAVLVIHAVDPAVLSGAAGPLLTPYLVLDVAAHVAVPLFVAVSGFVLMTRHPPPVAAGPFVAHRLGLLLPPYLLFSLLYLATGPAPNPAEALVRLLTGTAYFHLWFVPLMVELALLYPVLAPRVRRLASGALLPRLALLSLLASAYFLGKALLFLAPIGWAQNAILLQGLSFAGYLPFYVAGMAAAARPVDFNRLLARLTPLRATPVVLAALLLGGARYAAFQAPSPVLLALALLSFFLEPAAYLVGAALLYRAARAPLFARRPRLFAPLAALGAASYGIYLVHAGIIDLLIGLLAGVGVAPASPLYLPLVVLVTLALSVLIVGVVALLPGGARAIGYRGGRGG